MKKKKLHKLSRKCAIGELLMTEVHVHIILLAPKPFSTRETRMKIRFWEWNLRVNKKKTELSRACSIANVSAVARQPNRIRL